MGNVYLLMNIVIGILATGQWPLKWKMGNPFNEIELEMRKIQIHRNAFRNESKRYAFYLDFSFYLYDNWNKGRKIIRSWKRVRNIWKMTSMKKKSKLTREKWEIAEQGRRVIGLYVYQLSFCPFVFHYYNSTLWMTALQIYHCSTFFLFLDPQTNCISGSLHQGGAMQPVLTT